MKKHYRDEIRKTLILHSFFPFFIVLLCMVLFLVGQGTLQARSDGIRMRREISDCFVHMAESYLEKKGELAKEIDPKRYQRDSRYRTDWNREVLQFLNQQACRGIFYLFDEEGSELYSTWGEIPVQDVRGGISWAEKKRFSFIFYQNRDENRMDMAWTFFSPMIRQGKTTGYCGFAVPIDRFFRMQEEYRGIAILSNQYGRVFADGESVFWNERRQANPRLTKGKGFLKLKRHWYYVGTDPVYDNELYVTSVSSMDSVMKLCLASLLTGVFLLLIMAIAIACSARKVAGKATAMVDVLVGALEQVEAGRLDLKLAIETGDEFELIGESFNHMVGSIRHLIDRHRELAEENLNAKIQLMESQFDPHFVFNCLESIRYLIHLNPDNAESMTVSLARLMRYSISNERDIVTLSEELDFYRRYLEIMMYRYGKRLAYQIDVEKELRRMKIPRMLLQPLIENAVKYGFGNEKRTLRIRLQAKLRREWLELRIEDDGVGISAKLLEQLRDNLKQSENHSGHIGFYNVNHRLRLLYGEEAGLSIESQVGSGTNVTLLLPAEV